MCSSNGIFGENNWWWIIVVIILIWICCCNDQGGCGDTNGCRSCGNNCCC